MKSGEKSGADGILYGIQLNYPSILLCFDCNSTSSIHLPNMSDVQQGQGAAVPRVQREVVRQSRDKASETPGHVVLHGCKQGWVYIWAKRTVPQVENCVLPLALLCFFRSARVSR